MKQVTQSLMNGNTEVKEIPCPTPSPNKLRIKTTRSLISVGTERMLVEFGKANLIGKALQQPDKVRETVNKLKSDGVLATLEAVTNKLSQDIPLGYCNVGRVEEIGEHISGFRIGDRVVSNGYHAEIVCVPGNLCAKVPDNVSDEEAAFAIPGAIALQGLRLAAPTIGETIVVIGLGLLGLLTIQLLIANGCRVIGIDLDPEKNRKAEKLGAETYMPKSGEDWAKAGANLSKGSGVDAVIITASTSSSDPISQAAQMCRKKGRIVLVGVTGLELSRAEFYEKELSFQVSCSYGPGRHDPSYEDAGVDYPIGFVRWTLKRNIETVLELISNGRLSANHLVTHRYSIDDATKAYSLLTENRSNLTGIILSYPETNAKQHNKSIQLSNPNRCTTEPTISFIGAGNFSYATLIPAFSSTGARLKTIASNSGLSGVTAGQKYGFEISTTDIDTIMNDPDINAVVIATQHNSHVPLAIKALQAGKNVFIEKPLAISMEQHNDLVSALEAQHPNGHITVGFNRRKAPMIQRIKSALDTIHDPKAINMNINAGQLPADHWAQVPSVGGGRIIGEVCHFVDLARFLIGHPIVDYCAKGMTSPCNDTVSITLKFQDGSITNINYFANGHKGFAKERIDVFCNGSILSMDNYASLKGYGWPGFRNTRTIRRDKGHKAFAKAFVNCLRTGTNTIPLTELLEVSNLCLKIDKDITTT